MFVFFATLCRSLTLFLSGYVDQRVLDLTQERDLMLGALADVV